MNKEQINELEMRYFKGDILTPKEHEKINELKAESKRRKRHGTKHK